MASPCCDGPGLWHSERRTICRLFLGYICITCAIPRGAADSLFVRLPFVCRLMSLSLLTFVRAGAGRVHSSVLVFVFPSYVRTIFVFPAANSLSVSAPPG